jgi:hypothetical protein
LEDSVKLSLEKTIALLSRRHGNRTMPCVPLVETTVSVLWCKLKTSPPPPLRGSHAVIASNRTMAIGANNKRS